MSVQTNRALIERAYAAWNAGEQQFAEWMAEAVAPTVEMHTPQGDVGGIDMFRAYYHDIRAAFPDGRITEEDVFADDNCGTVVVRYAFSGTNTGKLLTLPLSTGRRASFVVMDVWQLDDGKVTALWEIYDRYGMLRQLGVTPEPSPALA